MVGIVVHDGTVQRISSNNRKKFFSVDVSIMKEEKQLKQQMKGLSYKNTNHGLFEFLDLEIFLPLFVNLFINTSQKQGHENNNKYEKPIKY